VDPNATDDPRGLRREDFLVHRLLPTRWSDEDVYGHVNNVIHYLMFDTAVNGWLIEATGVDIRGLPAIGLVVETSCRYFAELRFPDVVTAGIGLERLGDTSVVYRLRCSPRTGTGRPRWGGSCTSTSMRCPAGRSRSPTRSGRCSRR